LRGTDPSKPEAGSWWYAPGGGLEAGESHSAGAIREIWEETGFEVSDVGNPIWEREVRFNFNGVDYFQNELYFLVRTETFQPLPAAFSELEKSAIVEFRWWRHEELEASNEPIFPAALISRYRELLNGDFRSPIKLYE
jgi:8-oxo-dGTP pyrophosphatase MutT (NUDIX family)